MSTRLISKSTAKLGTSCTPVQSSVLQRKCPCAGTPALIEKCLCKKQKLQLQSKPKNCTAHSGVPPIVHEVLRSPGQPLDSETRNFMEAGFRHDFSKIRVHTDSKALESAKILNALAYTVGTEIVFDEGQYKPATENGRRLLAHELSHVLQHGGKLPTADLRVDQRGSASEQEADRIAEKIIQKRPGLQKVEQTIAEKLSLKENPRRRPCANTGLIVLQESPIVFTAEPMLDGIGALESKGDYATSVGLSLHVLASGDLSWLASKAAARKILSHQYWSPLLLSRGTTTLDRLLDELPRDLAPKIEGELASGKPLSWVRGAGRTGITFTEAELMSIPNLARRFNAGETLSQTEITLLARATEIHVGGTSSGSPFASYTRPNVELSFKQDSPYRVRVEIPRTNVIDVSRPNPITNLWAQSPNIEEMEFMATANHQGKIISVERMTGSTRPSALMKYSGAIRWGGRILIVVGMSLSTYRIATAPESEKLTVAAEEGGGLFGGAAGTALAVAGCVGFGLATGGLGLFICGLIGGVVGSTVGSAAASGMVSSLQTGSTPCPSCHALQREWKASRPLNYFQNLPTQILKSNDERLSIDGRSQGTRALTAQELKIIRQWLSEQPH